MMEQGKREPMFEMFLYESNQLIEQLEQTILDVERCGAMTLEQINQIFRVMHTIKGSSAMMMYNHISELTHYAEDLFHYLREHPSAIDDPTSLTDLVLSVSDAMKSELRKIDRGEETKDHFSELVADVKAYIHHLKEQGSGGKVAPSDAPRETGERQPQAESARPDRAEPGTTVYEAVLRFDEDCGMENIRCFTVVHNLKDNADIFGYEPEDIMTNHEGSSERIRRDGFRIEFSSPQGYDELIEFFAGSSYISKVDLTTVAAASETIEAEPQQGAKPSAEIKTPAPTPAMQAAQESIQSSQSHFLSVNVEKMDKLMDLVGELVISEAMVTEHPELQGLQLDQFLKAARQLRKITGELQDVVMSIRMVPLTATFQKMNRIVRDMSKKLNKDVALHIAGQETEVDKSIIEHLSDPLMHMIRNCVDHGLEAAEERAAAGKPAQGAVWLEARNAGGEVWITIRDDGRGLNKDNILAKAKANGLLHKAEEEYSEREIYSMIFLPGFSTKEAVTEYSGRGVGMDVANKNIQALGGTIHVESALGKGTSVVVKIPLTLAIIDGMTIKVGESRFTVPTGSIRESFRVNDEEIIRDPDGNEMLLIRGRCHQVLRLYERYALHTDVKALDRGVMLMVEYEDEAVCIFADELLGKQQVVVKSLPPILKKINGVSGCTLLGDGSISLILDISGLLQPAA
ncbi:chemotaxis protein CheA [Paenibacillus sp.]|uniref:chemotaxis protein CheA n=1 Tax=Paenibacillus sp. TaxID=58172 RepID=UPI00281234E7|nr:chemotaxis protein CheA [Paenibacillus sp.]